MAWPPSEEDQRKDRERRDFAMVVAAIVCLMVIGAFGSERAFNAVLAFLLAGGFVAWGVYLLLENGRRRWGGWLLVAASVFFLGLHAMRGFPSSPN